MALSYPEVTEEAEAVSESTDSEEVISMSRDRESQSGRSDVTSLPLHRQSRQNLPPNDSSSLSASLHGREEGSDWTGVDCFETLCSMEKVAAFIWGELGALVDWFGGSGSRDGVAVVASVLWLELRDCWMKLKLELKESCGEDWRAGLRLSSLCGREDGPWRPDVPLMALQSTGGRGRVTEQRKLSLFQELHVSLSGCCCLIKDALTAGVRLIL